jgi:hypothetical protein
MNKLMENWINGNRKEVSEALSHRPHNQVFSFVLLLYKGGHHDDVAVLAKLMDLYRDGHDKGD